MLDPIAGHLARRGGIPPEEFLRSSGALWWISRVLVAQSGGDIMYEWRRLVDKSRTSTVKIRASYF